MLKTLLLSCAVLCASSAGAQDYSTVLSLVQQWAPRVWLHPEEEFMPYNVSDYLNKVTPTYINCSTPTNCSYPSSIIPVGTDSQGYYLVTQDNRDDLLKDNSSFLYGVSPNVKNSSLPAFVTSCDSNNQHFIVTYWFFYGFDKGKRVINLGVFGQLPFIRDLNMRYLSKSAECHVGDLERMVLEIKDGVPKTLFLSVHSIGVYYDYDPTDGYFKVSSSKTKSMLKVLNPPKRLELVDGHPVIFSALGSHGVWASKGTHHYSKLGILLPFLSDQTGYGSAWDTWQDLAIYHVNSSSTLPRWYNYLGDWGNPGGNCITVPVIGAKICEFVDGPPPMNRTPDLYCSN